MARAKISASMKRTALTVAEAFITDKGTCRSVAKEFEMSKTHVHHLMTKILPKVSKSTYNEVRKVLDQNKAERAYRGGSATKKRYANLKKA